MVLNTLPEQLDEKLNEQLNEQLDEKLDKTPLIRTTKKDMVSPTMLNLNKHTKIITSLETLVALVIKDNDGVSSENIMPIVAHCMSLVGQYRKLTGTDKKSIVISLLTNAILKDINIDDNLKSILIALMETAVPRTIDLLIDVSRGKFAFKFNVLTKFIIWCKKYKCRR